MFISGQQIGNYTLVNKLGRGGFGEVWLAEKRSQFLVKRVAIKLPHEDQVDFDAVRREAEIWEQASGHPNVLPIIDADVYDGQVVIVSEYADGGSLSDKIKREGRLDIKSAIEMTLGILNGLKYLHSKKIVHRDIKPQNILLQGNTPRLADFGISRAINTSTYSSVVIGTEAYMAPEAFDGKRNVQTDVWSVGVVFYQLLKGSLPFPQEHPSERMFAVLTKPFEPLPGEIPARIRIIVQTALEKDPSGRYPSALSLGEDLQGVLDDSRVRSFPEQVTIVKETASSSRPQTDIIETVTRDRSSAERTRRYAPAPGRKPVIETPAPIGPPDGALPANRVEKANRIYSRPVGEKTAWGLDVNVGGMLCYIGNILCVGGFVYSIIVLVSDKEHKLPRFHALQSILWTVALVLISILIQLAAATSKVLNSDGLAMLVGLVIFVFYPALLIGAIFAARAAYQRQILKLPVIGGLADRWSD